MAFVAESIDFIRRVQRLAAPITTLSPASAESGGNSERSEYTIADYPGILNSDLTTLAPNVRVGFIVTVSFLFALSLWGNIGTLPVNFHRKIRPFFRACLISLAFSDLLNSVFLSLAYLGQFSGKYVQVWLLGRIMCHLVPFVTTAAILASSMTLVGIALDRYFAIKAVASFWNPSVTCCVLCTLSIWIASAGIAFPVFRVYGLFPVYVLEQESGVDEGAEVGNDSDGERIGADDAMIMSVVPTAASMDKSTAVLPKVMAKIPATTIKPAIDTTTATTWEAAHRNLSYTPVKQEELVDMCLSNQRDVAVYYIIVFAIIFIPCILAFICLNAAIAKNFWIRRHGVTFEKKHTHKSAKRTLRCSHKCRLHKHRNSIKIQPKAGIKQAEMCSSKENEKQLDFNSPKDNCQCQAAGLQQDSSGGPLKTPNKPATANLIDNNHTDSHNTHTAAHGHRHGHSHGHCHNHNHSHNHNHNHNHNHSHSHSNRESRHRRMFTIILLLMAVFLFFRLPAWIFLIMRMYGTFSFSSHWMLYFCVGVLHLASCVLNPLFYTFLPETIQCALFVKVKIIGDLCGFRTCCERYRQRRTQQPAAVSVNYGGCGSAAVPPEAPKTSCDCFGWVPMTRISCGPLVQPTDDQSQPQWRASVVLKPVDVEILGNNDEDEGVECSDASSDDDSSTDFYDYNQHIYTIFSAELVSSSVTSELQY